MGGKEAKKRVSAEVDMVFPVENATNNKTELFSFLSHVRPYVVRYLHMLCKQNTYHILNIFS